MCYNIFMNLSWRLQRQILIFTIYFLIVAIPVAFITKALLAKSPTCFDNIQNQDEEGVDCGGNICSLRCDGNYRDIKINFSRGLFVSPGKYDIFTLLENFNQNVDFPVVPYTMSFYSYEGKLLGNATGTISVEAQHRAAVYLPNLDLAQEPKTVEFNLGLHKAVASKNTDPKDLLNVQNWQSQRGAEDSLQVIGELNNPYNESISDVDVYAMLYDDTKTVYAVSKTNVVYIKGREKQAVAFTWGNIKSPQNVEFVVVQNN